MAAPKNPYPDFVVPDLPRAHHVARGYYTSAYFVVEPEPLAEGNAPLALEAVETFDPQEEPDYFLEFGYPEPVSPNSQPNELQTILLCHGLAANGLQFVADAHYFAGKGFRVIVPDLRGHGRSTCPEQRRDEDFSIEVLASDLVAILDAEKISAVHWVGSSLGGILGLTIMGLDPTRLKSFTSFGTAYTLSVPPLVVSAAVWFYKLAGPKWLARRGAPLTSARPEVQALIYTMLKTMDMDAISRIAHHLGNYNLVQQALNFEGPILMLQGERDKDINRALKKTLPLMASHPKFKAVLLPDAGHVENLDKPAEMRQTVLDFLAGLL